MLDIEPFLRGIFAAPADDLPRLVFADWLDEHDQGAWAEVIRLGCEAARHPAGDPTAEGLFLRIDRLIFDHNLTHAGSDRGFRYGTTIELSADAFRDADAFRRVALTTFPHWYGAMRLKVTADRITHPAALQTILTSPVTERVTELDLRGREVDIELVVCDGGTGLAATISPLYDTEQQPVITVKMVEALARIRECRRLTRLDLRNNDLDNDALRALAQSPYLHRLERLDLVEGNHRFKGRVWQQVLERFGPDVVQ